MNDKRRRGFWGTLGCLVGLHRWTIVGYNSIILPTRLGTATQAAGAFRAEGSPIKVSGLTFGSLTLTPKNLAVILTATEEMIRRSKAVDLAAYFQNAIIKDTATALDTLYVSATAGSVIQPAGIRNSLPVGDTRPASGTGTAANIMTDLKAMLTAMSNANMGGSQTVWMMHSKNWLAVSMALNAVGTLMFPETANGTLVGIPVIVSNTIDPAIVLLQDCEWITFAMGAPQFDVSMQATLHEETVPLPISSVGTPNVVAAPVRSLFQTNTSAFRMLLDADWAKLRPTGGSVQELTSVAWQ